MIQFLRRAPAVAARASVRQGGTENRMLTQRNLRQTPRISYYEPEEPDLDEYVFCEKCGDYVYEYCSIHGPLLVIPDDKVPTNHNFPTCVPRAALTIPNVFLHLFHSIIPDYDWKMVCGIVLASVLIVMWAPCIRRGLWADRGPVYAKDRQNRVFRIAPTGNCCDNKCRT